MKNKNMPLFRIRLENLRRALGVTQARFAYQCGFTQAAMSQILSGKRTPSLETLKRIHMATGVSIDHLLGIKTGLEPLDENEKTKKKSGHDTHSAKLVGVRPIDSDERGSGR